MSAQAFPSIAAVRIANREMGFNFFARDTMRFFSSRIESRLYGGRYFITGERAPSALTCRYTVRRANDDGSIDTVGDFQQYAHIEDARTMARAQAQLDQQS